MDKRKKALILAVMSTMLPLSGCGKKNEDTTITNSNITQEYTDTIEKEFAIGEHYVIKTYFENSVLISANYKKTKKNIEDMYIPEGYAIVDFEFITDKGNTSGIAVVFVNNKPVNAIGGLNSDGNYHFDEFGNVIKEKVLVK